MFGSLDYQRKATLIFDNMSRIGNAPVIIPEQVNIEVSGREIKVQGPLGSLSLRIRPEVDVKIEDNQILVSRKSEEKAAKAFHGLTRSLIANMVSGVARGWQKKLELVGVGYRAQINGEKLILNVGYSHPVEVVAPEGIKFNVTDNTKIEVSGIDKNLVGQVAASVRKVKPPEPYQGKGIRIAGEYVRRKAGKAGKVGAK